jgi:hypothetical protein
VRQARGGMQLVNGAGWSHPFHNPAWPVGLHSEHLQGFRAAGCGVQQLCSSASAEEAGS